MQNEIHRRLQLGLPITGPYSRNQRRRHGLRRYQWRNLTPYAISAAIAIAFILFLTGLFTL